jgi:hypothetical protein
MREIIIDEEFRYLLPTLDEETFRLLEESLLEHGCRDPLVLWDGILIDGYNRFKICSHHGLPFATVEMEFDSREEAVIWIITNQISRRNLTSTQLSHFRGLHYNAEKKIQGTDRLRSQNVNKSQNETFNPGSTASRLAEQYKVARATIARDSKLSAGLTKIGEVSPETKRKILNGEVRISKSRLESLASASREEVEAVVREIEEGTFVNRAPRGSGGGSGASGSSNAGDSSISPPGTGSQGAGWFHDVPDSDSMLPEIRQLGAIISDFANSFNSMLGELGAGNSAPLKEVLRSYIDELEALYRDL